MFSFPKCEQFLDTKLETAKLFVVYLTFLLLRHQVKQSMASTEKLHDTKASGTNDAEVFPPHIDSVRTVYVAPVLCRKS